MFAGIGVQLEARTGLQYCESAMERTIIINMSSPTPSSRLPGALAYAMLYEGQHIEIFYDRVLRDNTFLTTKILGYVLVHEITHLLQGVPRHSASGIMKARWGFKDYKGRPSDMVFTEADIELIHRGLALRDRDLKGRPTHADIPPE